MIAENLHLINSPSVATLESMYLSELIPDFIEHLEVEGGRSLKTAQNYQLYLERFLECTGDVPVDKITTEMVRKYRLWLNRYKNYNDQDLSTITQAYHLIALRGFLTYLSRRDISSKRRQDHPTKNCSTASDISPLR